jgi:predicted GNAT family acetyltransferase
VSTDHSSLVVQHQQTDARGAFYVERDGVRLGELVYARSGEGTVNVEHTEVDAALRGQGVARQLLDALVGWARATGTRVQATCPYARAQFRKDASIRDVYAG